MTIPAPIIVRLYEAMGLLFPSKGAQMPQLANTVPLRNCVLCRGLATPPSRMGVILAPERQEIFVCCGSCSDCSDSELEAKILAKVSEPGPPMAIGERRDIPTTAQRQPAWAARAAKEWTQPGSQKTAANPEGPQAT